MSYTEDSLVEQPAIQLFAELGWETLSASDEVMGTNALAECVPSPQPSPGGRGSYLGRETKSEVVLAVRLRNVLVRLNPSLPPEAISAAVDELLADVGQNDRGQDRQQSLDHVAVARGARQR